MSDIPEEVWLEAKEKLGYAIKECCETVDPDAYIDDWVLVVHKDSVELTMVNQSIVSTIVPYGQAFHRTTGLLTHVIRYEDKENNGGQVSGS